MNAPVASDRVAIIGAGRYSFRRALADFQSSPSPAGFGKPLDLPALAQKARPAGVLIVGYDAGGKVIKTGSGFFVSADGRLVTNCHVIEGIVNATAKLESGAIYNIDGVLASSSALVHIILHNSTRARA